MGAVVAVAVVAVVAAIATTGTTGIIGPIGPIGPIGRIGPIDRIVLTGIVGPPLGQPLIIGSETARRNDRTRVARGSAQTSPSGTPRGQTKAGKRITNATRKSQTRLAERRKGPRSAIAKERKRSSRHMQAKLRWSVRKSLERDLTKSFAAQNRRV